MVDSWYFFSVEKSFYFDRVFQLWHGFSNDEDAYDAKLLSRKLNFNYRSLQFVARKEFDQSMCFYDFFTVEDCFNALIKFWDTKFCKDFLGRRFHVAFADKLNREDEKKDSSSIHVSGFDKDLSGQN